MEQIRAFLDYIGHFNTASILIRVFLAVIAGGIIGSERGRHGRAAGFRTHILVCLGGAVAAMTGHFLYLGLGPGTHRHFPYLESR